MSSTEERQTTEPAGDERTGAVRRGGVVALVIIAIITGFVGNLSGWAWWFLFDSGNFVKVVAPLSEDEQVSEVIANRLVQQAFEGLDLEMVVEDALPNRASFLAGPITTGAESFAQDAVEALIQSDAFKAIWREALTVAHQAAIDILRGNDGRIVAEDGQVVLDLSGAVQTVSDALSSVGLDVFSPDQLPDDFGQIVLFEDEQLGTTQRAVELLDKASIWLPIIALASWIGALLLARRRRRMFTIIGFAIAASYLVQLAMLRVTRRSLLDNIAESDARQAAGIVWDEITTELRAGMWAAVVIGLLIALGAYLVGPAPRAVQIRAAVLNRLHQVRGERDPNAEPDLAQRIFSPYRRAIQVVILALALLYVITLATPSVASVLVVAVLVIVALALVELAAGPRLPTDQGD